MENDNFKKLETLIEALTHSGSNSIDEDVFKQVKKICKSSQAYIPCAYSCLLRQMTKDNSQIRFIAFQMCKELFSRSSLFREHLIKDLRQVFELTSEFNSENKLPPPKASAENLKVFAIATLKHWVEEYGKTYKELIIAYNYLKTCKKVDFEHLEMRNTPDQIAANEEQRKFREFCREKMRKLQEEFNCNEPEIQLTITSLSNCLSLLMPTLEEFFILENHLQEELVAEQTSEINICKNNKNEFELESNKNNLRLFGISPNYNLSLELHPEESVKIVITEENISIIENAKDCVRLINSRFLPMVKNWMKIHCKYSEGESTTEIKKIIDLKDKLENVLKKYSSLNIENDKDVCDDASSSEDEFEEVKKEGYEDYVNMLEEDLIKFHKGEEIKEKSFLNTKNNESYFMFKEMPEVNAPSTSKTLTNEESERKKKLLAIAPKLPFDVDLYHWEDKNLTPPTLISTKIDVDKFWGCAESDDIHEIPNPEGLAALRTRVIEFSGKFEPVKWSCRAPLPNGKLCPRKDRFKCPFHGKIVPRDENGICKNEEDKKILEQKKEKLDTSEWQDPNLLKDIEAATGVDLKMPEGRKKRKKFESNNLTHKKMKTSSAALKIVESKKLPGLIDVIKRQNNAYTRLCKKIFHRSSLKRVSSVLNKLDRNKFQDKFGDQFNYS